MARPSGSVVALVAPVGLLPRASLRALTAACVAAVSSAVAAAVVLAVPGCGGLDAGPATVGGAMPSSATSGAPSSHGGTLVGSSNGAGDSVPGDRARETWYLDADGARLTLVLDGASATLTDEASGAVDAVEAVRRGHGTLAFLRRAPDGSATWFAARTAAGVLAGRSGAGPAPTSLVGSRHVTGWQAEALADDPLARTYELLVSDGARVRLRLAADGAGAGHAHPAASSRHAIARWKVYASIAAGADAEASEHDLAVATWDGHTLDATDPDGGGLALHATVTARRIVGALSDGRSFTGERAEVLGHGLLPRADLPRWQRDTRDRLALLALAGAPAALATSVSELSTSAPIVPVTLAPRRDDDPDRSPQAYRLHELAFSFTLSSTLPDGGAGPALVRRAHGYLALPDAPPPPGGFPVVVALNGHGGSARRTFDPDDELYWYGDAWARRGAIVLAVDIGHRPVADRADLYGDTGAGDDPLEGNGAHPAIAAAGLDSDWEEDGERTWDVMRAIDWLLARPDVDRKSLTVTGLSMGGEIATFVAALDPRVAVAAVAGFSPDLGVLLANGNHPCWRWRHGDVREYLDVSDLHALVAPRGLVVETGAVDPTFSRRLPPFAADKQVLRRSRAAFAGAGDPPRLVHYLHDDAHHYHVGERGQGGGVATGVLAPITFAPGGDPAWPWQDDPRTAPIAPSLFALVATWRR